VVYISLLIPDLSGSDQIEATVSCGVPARWRSSLHGEAKCVCEYVGTPMPKSVREMGLNLSVCVCVNESYLEGDAVSLLYRRERC
jgi:hypothetical protein